jgi:hypothetical protein
MMPVKSRIHVLQCCVFFLCSLAWSASIRGQDAVRQGIRVTASTPRILLGEPFSVSVQSTFAEGVRPARWPVLPDSFPHFEMLEPVKTDSLATGGLITVTRVYRLTSFDSGRWKLPVLSATAGKKRYQSDTLSVEVHTVPLEGNAYRDIHEIIEVQETPVNWKLWAAILFSLALLGLGIRHYLRNRAKPKPQKPAFDSKLSPLEQALQALHTLRSEGLVERGDAKAHFSRLSDTLRIFLTRKFVLPVMAETTDGILLRLKDKGTGRETLSSLAALLRLSDAVKFAKFTVRAEEAVQSVDQMETVIKVLNQQNPEA